MINSFRYISVLSRVIFQKMTPKFDILSKFAFFHPHTPFPRFETSKAAPQVSKGVNYLIQVKDR